MRIAICEITHQGAKAVAAEREIELPEAATVEEAILVLGRDPQEAGLGLSIYARRAQLTDVLVPGDRLELSEPLLVDPREARRMRAERQGDVRFLTCGRHGGKHRLAK